MTEESPPPGPFATWLASMSVALGYPREADLARALDLPQSTVSRWRKGSRPSVEHLWRLGRLLKTDLEPLLVLAGHIPGNTGVDPFAAPPSPPSATTETVRRIKDADMPERMKDVVFAYWERRLAEERSRVYAFISEFSGPPRPGDTSMRAWLAKAYETALPVHVTDAFLDLLTMQVERMQPPAARKRAPHGDAQAGEEEDPREPGR